MGEISGKTQQEQPAAGRERTGSGKLLAIVGLTKSFSGRVVVRDAQLEVNAGEVVGLLGRNGAGKTTTFRMVMGMLRPDSGRVLLDGEDVTRLPMYLRARRGAGYLAQEPSVFQRLTVEQNLKAVLEMQPGMDRDAQASRLEALLAELGLATVRKSMAFTLSGGERRRLEIARALVSKPKLMLCDEPFVGIDPITVSELRGHLRRLREQGMGILLTDHNVRDTLSVTDRAYIMDEGKIWIQGTPAEIVENPEARRLYLGTDFKL